MMKMTSTTNLAFDDWEKITMLLPDGWQDKARECGALKFGRQFISSALFFCSGCC